MLLNALRVRSFEKLWRRIFAGIFSCMNGDYLIEKLDLQPHPEGGFYAQTYRSNEMIPATALPDRFNGERCFSTTILYLIQKGDFSGFHRIKSDECWYFHEGGSITIHVIGTDGNYKNIVLGKKLRDGDFFQCVVPAGAWFAVEPSIETEFALTGCSVSPGFDFRDFELAEKKILSDQFPQHSELINRLCRK